MSDGVRPLEGVRVLDLTHAGAGPYCTMLLGFLGADIIKIEPPSGEHFRGLLYGAFFASLNFNKRSVVLDLKTPQGKETFFKLVPKSDVIVESFRPGVTERLGIDYESVRKVKPDIIYCSISGFGHEGPYRDYPAYDPAIQAISGLMANTGYPDRPPVRIGASVIDWGSGMMAAFLIVASLLKRKITGEGERIDVALFDIALSYMNYWIAYYTLTGKVPQRVGSALEHIAPYQVFETADKEIFIGCLHEEFWRRLCEILGRRDLLEDPRFATREKRWENRRALEQELTREFKKYTRDELVNMLVKHIPCAPVKTVDELINDPHVKERGLLTKSIRPEDGKECLTTGVPFKLKYGKADIRRLPPKLGEHTEEVIKELLGD